MFAVSFTAVLLVLGIHGVPPWYAYVPTAGLTALVMRLVELYTRNGMDTVTAHWRQSVCLFPYSVCGERDRVKAKSVSALSCLCVIELSGPIILGAAYLGLTGTQLADFVRRTAELVPWWYIGNIPQCTRRRARRGTSRTVRAGAKLAVGAAMCLRVQSWLLASFFESGTGKCGSWSNYCNTRRMY